MDDDDMQAGGDVAAPTGDADAPASALPANRTALTYQNAMDLVNANNLSNLPPELVTALMYRESSLNPLAASSGSSAKGLTQMTKGAIQDVLNNSGKFPDSSFPPTLQDAQNNVYDPATNVRLGTAYLQLLLNRNGGDVTRALNAYSGSQPGYAQQVQAAGSALQADDSNPMATLRVTYGQR